MFFRGGDTFSGQLDPATSGTSTAPVTYTSYGTGRATISGGEWEAGHSWMVFDGLVFGAEVQVGGSAGNGDHVVLRNSLVDIGGATGFGVLFAGTGDMIDSSTIQNTGDSGIYLLGGGTTTVRNSTIQHTGLIDVGHGEHGIYDRASTLTATGNTISDCHHGDGISVRYHNSDVEQNTISNCNIGLSFYEYDTVGGTAKWWNNTITTPTAAVYTACGSGGGCAADGTYPATTYEHFDIEHNKLLGSTTVDTSQIPASQVVKSDNSPTAAGSTQ